MDLKRIENENEEQYLWRLGQAKDAGLIDIDWAGIADLMNKEFREDESEYRNESAYRKPYQYTKKMYESGVFKRYEKESYVDNLAATKDELRKEKQKLFDERKALNKMSRDSARAEEDLERLRELIMESGATTLPETQPKMFMSDNDMIITLSDFHYGASYENHFGSYNPDVARERLAEYLRKVIELRDVHHSQDAYILILGDNISGNIHWTTQLENRENLIRQVQECSELITAFVYEVSKCFNYVYVNSVPGNHSRVGLKDQVLRGERLDDLIPWYMKAKLSHIENIEFMDDNPDPTIARLYVRDQTYLMCHGDFDSFSEAGVSKLVMMLGRKPEAVFYGHMHHCSYDDISGVKLIRSGSFGGTGDDYTVSKRIYGRPQQMVCIADEDGIKALYPIELH